MNEMVERAMHDIRVAEFELASIVTQACDNFLDEYGAQMVCEYLGVPPERTRELVEYSKEREESRSESRRRESAQAVSA